MDRPKLTITSVTIGAPDPRALADFYGRLMGWPVAVSEPARPGEPPEDGWAQLKPVPVGSGPTLNFEYEPGHRPPTWPSVTGEQQTQEHLDIAVSDLDASVRWAEQAGARLADFQPQQDVRVMFDPAGHPFCLFLSE